MVYKLLEGIAPILQSHAGREKSCRIIFYYLMFLIPTLQKLKGKRALTDKEALLLQNLDKVKGNMSMSRKIFRFGMQIPIFLGIMKRLRDH